MTALVLTGLLMTIPFLLAFVSISLWMAFSRPGIAPGHSQAASCLRAKIPRRSRHARITGPASHIACHSVRSTSAIAAVQPTPRERSRYDHPADAVADPWAGAEDDTDLDYYDTPSGNIWRLDAQPGRAAAKVL